MIKLIGPFTLTIASHLQIKSQYIYYKDQECKGKQYLTAELNDSKFYFLLSSNEGI